MSEDHTVTFNLRVDSSEAIPIILELNRLLTTYAALARRVGLPENIMDAIARLQQIRVSIMATYRSLQLLHTVLMAPTPIGLAMAIGGLGVSGLMLADQMELERPRY